MATLERRIFLAGLAATAAPAITRAQSTRPYRMLLNTAFSGPQAWLLLAQDNGHLRQAGIELQFTTGEGAFTAAPRMAAEGFDLGYGDINSAIEVAATRPADAPVGVFMMFNASPATIAVKADGPIHTPADLRGRRLTGHATDVALRTFGAFCAATGLDRQSVAVATFDGSMRAQAEAMLKSPDIDGMFGYVSTIKAALASAGLDPDRTLRFLPFAEYVPDLYGSALLASPRIMRDDPAGVAAVVRALNRGLVDVLANKPAAIEAVIRRDGAVRREVELLRLQTTLDIEMGHPEGRTLGIGDIDDARLARGIALVAATNRLPRTPAPKEVFVRDFLPPLAERVTSLAPAPRRYKALLNTSLSGPVSFFLLAESRGHLRAEGIDLALAPGEGAAVIVPQVQSGTFDVGYGDVTALIERIARGAPNEGPVAIFTTFNTVPFTIAVPEDGPIRTPKDLEGRTITGHRLDAALLTFDMFAKATGIDPARVRIAPAEAPMGQQVAALVKDKSADGIFGFVNTLIATGALYGVDGRKQLRFLTYAEYLPDMYGNTLFVTRELYRADKPALTGIVRALNKALVETVADPDVAIDALMQKDPSLRRDVNHARLVGTLKTEMAHPEGAKIGIGDMDDARLARLIALVVDAKKLPRTPTVSEVFDRAFLPPLDQRVRTLAG